MDERNRTFKRKIIEKFVLSIALVTVSGCVINNQQTYQQRPNEFKKKEAIPKGFSDDSNFVFYEYCLVASDNFEKDKQIALSNAQSELIKGYHVNINSSVEIQKTKSLNGKNTKKIQTKSIHKSNRLLTDVSLESVKYIFRDGVKYLCVKIKQPKTIN